MRKLAIIGLGLIGGSLARALYAAGHSGRISAFDADPRQGERGLELGLIDENCGSAAEAVDGADCVVIAVPVLHTAEAITSFREAFPENAILTDVGSTKLSVMRDVAQAFGEQLPPRFVAGHPIAGTEKSGVNASKADLFKGHRVILTPHDAQDASALREVRHMWELVGARVVEMEAQKHDAIFAATSHLPHVLAYAFVDMLTRLEAADEIFPNAGGGFRDFTRIASSSPEMWHDIVRANKNAVTALLEMQISELKDMLDLMKKDQWDALQERFQRARNARERHLGQIE